MEEECLKHDLHDLITTLIAHSLEISNNCSLRVASLKSRAQNYYSLVRCWCNLHAMYCVIKGTRMACVCKHNTDGDLCERCLPLFNNRPWSSGSYLPYPTGAANECQGMLIQFRSFIEA